LRGDVVPPFQFGQRFAQRASADLEFLSQLMLAGQQKAVLHEAAFDAPDEFVDHPLFLVKSYLSNHVQIDTRNKRGRARDI
jgi:UDP-glucose 4-epimerase